MRAGRRPAVASLAPPPGCRKWPRCRRRSRRHRVAEMVILGRARIVQGVSGYCRRGASRIIDINPPHGCRGGPVVPRSHRHSRSGHGHRPPRRSRAKRPAAPLRRGDRVWQGVEEMAPVLTDSQGARLGVAGTHSRHFPVPPWSSSRKLREKPAPHRTSLKLTPSSLPMRWILARSRGSIRVIETPFLPARAVRPLRWV